MCDKFSASLSNGCNNCNFFPFKTNSGFPFGNTKSKIISEEGSPSIGNSAGIVFWPITERKNTIQVSTQ